MSNEDWIEMGLGVRALRLLEPGGQIGIYRLILEPGAIWPAHAHPQREAWYALRGEGSVRWRPSDGVVLTHEVHLVPGIAAVVPGGLPHEIVALGDGLELLSIAIPDWHVEADESTILALGNGLIPDAAPINEEAGPRRECSIFACPGPAKSGPRCGAQTANGDVCIRAPHDDGWHHARDIDDNPARRARRAPRPEGEPEGVSEAELFASAEVIHFTGNYRIRQRST